jgi:D-glycero-alpha-D-manno-heptose-7-phosphate kinase
MNINNFVIEMNCTIRDALNVINLNSHGIIFGIDKNHAVIGVATDGDIRRCLSSKSSSLDSSVEGCLNNQFIWATTSTPREYLLKQLDNRIKVIPILNKEMHLVDIVTRNNFPLKQEESIYSRSRAPARISFGGGGSDLTHFFSADPGAVLNTTINSYCHATLKILPGLNIKVHSKDLNEKAEALDLDEFLSVEGNFGLIQAVLKTIRPQFGFALYIESDFPIRSGLGGSAAVAAAILGCFNEFRKDKWTSRELAELSFQAERLHLNIAGGWQDQYASVYGGFNFIEFDMQKNLVHPLRIANDTLHELEECLVLCNTGIQHNSGDVHLDQKSVMTSELVKNKVKENVDITYSMREYLLSGDLHNFGLSLDKAWKLKRNFGNKISSVMLDKIYEKALNAGAVGGKLLGAGGGGFFLFYVEPFKRGEVIEALESDGYKSSPCYFDLHGLQSWTARERS